METLDRGHDSVRIKIHPGITGTRTGLGIDPIIIEQMTMQMIMLMRQ